MNSDKNDKPYAVLPAGHVRAIQFQPVPQLIRKLGGSPESVFRDVNMAEAVIQNPETVLPLTLAGELLVRSAKETGCEHFGLLLGSLNGLDQLGPIAKMMAQQPTIGSALDQLIQIHHMTNRAGLPFVRQDGDHAYFGFAAMESNFPGFQHFHEGVMAIAFNIMRKISHVEWTPDAVYFSHRPPKDPQAHSRFFGAPCHFNSPRAEFQFPLATLSAPNASMCADSICVSDIAQVTMSELDWLEKARRFAHSLVASGNCGQNHIAAALGISVRTMNRRLEQAGVSYFEILDNARYSVSRKLIRETDMTLKEIAKALSYTDASSFTRAFRRWSGVSPEQWRKTRCA
ncbi:AraC family transcriptional regulator [Pseudomonas sp. MAP12]|uniref:AraC family transcriptional regulator n=1 Tax=Geopseudomonas aromaticivorans TaxID=2849492 RepID=A0ABS6MSG3_9GAMM|nr:AraC family transcriptional regulator [Pseudomonas aromaticivorans]MBV2131743.1 AraC family transcriptional regulator [Pseudomonas aromaticivorans]